MPKNIDYVVTLSLQQKFALGIPSPYSVVSQQGERECTRVGNNSYFLRDPPPALFLRTLRAAQPRQQRNFARKIAAVYTAARGTNTVTAVYDIQSCFSFNITGAHLPRCFVIYGMSFLHQ